MLDCIIQWIDEFMCVVFGGGHYWTEWCEPIMSRYNTDGEQWEVRRCYNCNKRKERDV